MDNYSKEIPDIDLFSDGGAEPNPGKGGYGVILSWQGKGYRKEFSQGYKVTTNNRMELLGVITGLEKLKTRSRVNVYTDSRYVVDGIENGWAQKWKINNWYRTKSEKAINADLWERLLNLISQHEVKFNWVKGHNGHPENERCDYLATQAIQSDNLMEDTGFDLQTVVKTTNTKASGKIKNEGDLCRHCNTPVVKRFTKDKIPKPNQSYFFEYYMYCPQCKKMYMVEEAKKYIDHPDPPRLF